MTIVTTQPDSVFVQVEPLFRSEYGVELRLENEADLPLGYALSSPVFTPSTATVEGPASLVKTVQNVVVALNVAGRRGSVDQNLPLRVLDAIQRHGDVEAFNNGWVTLSVVPDEPATPAEVVEAS